MPALFVERGWGQVEANRLTGITFGDIEAQAPAYEDAEGTTPIKELENGMFLCVIPDSTTKGIPGASMGRVAVLPGEAPATARPFLVFSERKQYDEREMYCDFVDKASDKVDGLLYPRLVGVTPDACIYTTNTINATAGSLEAGDVLYIGDDGYPTTTVGKNTTYALNVIKVYTMPDGQEGVKLQVVSQ